MGIDGDKTYTLRQAVALSGFAYHTLWLHIKMTGNLPASKFGASWAVKGHDLLRFMEDHEVKSKKQPVYVGN